MEPTSEHQVIILAAGSSRRLAHLTTERPKSLLPVGDRPLIVHGLDALAERGYRRVTLVVGYLRERLMSTLGARHGPLDIEYVVSEDYATTEHGWSLYLAREPWARERRPVLFLDADNVYQPALLDRVRETGERDVMLVDPAAPRSEEELVLGHAGRVTGLARGRADEHADCVGLFVGINRFSGELLGRWFRFAETFLGEHGRSFKYERIFDAFVRTQEATIAYATTGPHAWVNVNHPQDLERARALVLR